MPQPPKPLCPSPTADRPSASFVAGCTSAAGYPNVLSCERPGGGALARVLVSAIDSGRRSDNLRLLEQSLGVPLLRFPASKLRWGEARRRCDAIKRPSDYLVNLAHAHLLKHARHCFFERGIATAVLAFEDDARFAVANGGAALGAALNEAPDTADFVHLGWCSAPKHPECLHAYVLTRSAVDIALNRTAPCGRRPMDQQLSALALSGVLSRHFPRKELYRAAPTHWTRGLFHQASETYKTLQSCDPSPARALRMGVPPCRAPQKNWTILEN